MPKTLLKQLPETVANGRKRSETVQIEPIKDGYALILYVKRGSYRIGSVAMVSPFDTEVLLTREIVVMRVNPDNNYGITPHYMLYAMSHRLVQMQTENKVLIETTLPNIGNRWQQLAIPVPKDKEVLKKISGRIESIIKSKWDAIEQIAAIRKELGSITT